MTRLARWTAFSGVLGALTVVGAVGADEEKIPVDKLPAAVLKAAKDKFPKATVEEASKEVEDGVTTYEIALKDGEHEIELELKADGTIVEIEKEIAADALPEAVKKAVAAKYPNDKIKKAEEVTKGETGSPLYEVEVGSAELVLDAQGKIIKTEDEKGKDKDDDDEAPKTAK